MPAAPRPLRRERRPDGRVLLVTGSSGSGKTSWTAQQVAGAPRLLVWDVLGQWAREYRCKPVADLRDLAPRIVPGAAPSRVAFQSPPTAETFAAFCSLAWVYVRAHGAPLVVEELADVTTPGRAPLAWGEIVRKSRHYGADVYGLTQRPAESDKTIVGNAAVIHAGLMAFRSDRTYVARCLDVPEADVAGLAQLEWIERNMRTRELTRGKMRFTGRRRA